MLFLFRSLKKESFTYTSTKSRSELHESVLKIFKEGRKKNSDDLSGNFISDSEFYLTSEIPSFGTPGKTDHINLRGKIRVKENKTIIDLMTEPAPRTFIVFCGSFFFGLVLLGYLMFSSTVGIPGLLYVLIFLLLIPLAVLFFGMSTNDKIKNRFVKMLDLNKV